MTCLPLVRANDDIADCRGASDEVHYCRFKHPQDKTIRYRCWNSTECVDTRYLCEDYIPLHICAMTNQL
jgi:hypothetical protein